MFGSAGPASWGPFCIRRPYDSRTAKKRRQRLPHIIIPKNDFSWKKRPQPLFLIARFRYEVGDGSYCSTARFMGNTIMVDGAKVNRSYTKSDNSVIRVIGLFVFSHTMAMGVPHGSKTEDCGLASGKFPSVACLQSVSFCGRTGRPAQGPEMRLTGHSRQGKVYPARY